MKKLSFEKPLYVLAPLAGYTDLPFRAVVKKFGADLTVSEMLSSNALAYGSERTLHMLEKSGRNYSMPQEFRNQHILEIAEMSASLMSATSSSLLIRRICCVSLVISSKMRGDTLMLRVCNITFATSFTLW